MLPQRKMETEVEPHKEEKQKTMKVDQSSESPWILGSTTSLYQQAAKRACVQM